MFRAPSPEKVAEALLYEAQRLAIEHQAAAEHHKALADMYAGRVTRLTQQQSQPTETATS